MDLGLQNKKADIVIGFERIGDLNSRKFNESTIDQEKSLLYYRLKEQLNINLATE